MLDSDLTAPLVLATDVSIVPVRHLPEALQAKLRGHETDFAIYRSHGRATTKLINPESKTLLQTFRSPKTLSQSLAETLRGRAERSPDLLEQAYDLVDSMLRARFLVRDGSPDALSASARFQSGAVVGSWTIEENLQALEDGEVYRVAGKAGVLGALKIARPSQSSAVGDSLSREAAILSALGGAGAAPALLDAGAHEDDAFIVTEWIPGIGVDRAASEFRLLDADSARGALKRLVVDILDAYAKIHARGVVHGDVHVGNLIYSAEGVRILDFGLANLASSPSTTRTPRGGVLRFLEPEYAASVSRGESPPRASFAGEQYSLAALLYLLISGAEYVDFALNQTLMIEQIISRPPISFAHHGAPAWPDMERALFVALSKDPQARFASVKTFRDAVAHVEDAPVVSCPVPRPLNSELDKLADGVLKRVADGPTHPNNRRQLSLASLNSGVGGVAYALYRAAVVTGQSGLLDLANAYHTMAANLARTPSGFYSHALNTSPLNVGWVSPYHTIVGVHALDALLGAAYGDIGRMRRGSLEFIAAASGREACSDLTLGLSGVLLAATLMFERVAEADLETKDSLLRFGDEIVRRIWVSEADEEPISYTGIAHGWAGLIYAALRWGLATGRSPPAAVSRRTDWLAALAEPHKHGARWKWSLLQRDENYMTGWCGGAAGMVHLWTATQRVFGRHGALAEKAANYCIEAQPLNGDLCCGCAGISWALIHLCNETGDKTWREHAVAFADAAVRRFSRSDPSPLSLFSGSLVAVPLAADLRCPEQAAMPFFGGEGP
jgi:eukaryotic-like serine/threonine-protein kinase